LLKNLRGYIPPTCIVPHNYINELFPNKFSYALNKLKIFCNFSLLGVNRVRSNTFHSQWSDGMSSRPETPLKYHLSDHPGKSSPTVFVLPPIELLELDVDIVLNAWLEQMERFPISIQPKNTQTFPPSIFISYDFICWLLRFVSGMESLDDAIGFASKLVNEGRIKLLQTPSDSENFGEKILFS